VHNELWVAADSASYLSESPSHETETSYIGPSYLQKMTLNMEDSDKAKNGGNTMKSHNNVLSISKDCNIVTQMELDQICHRKDRSNWLCDELCSEHEVHQTSSLPDYSSLNHWHCYYSNSACPIHQSASHLSVFNDNQLYGRSFSLYSPPCSPRAYRQHLVAIRRQIIRASLPVMCTKSK